MGVIIITSKGIEHASSDLPTEFLKRVFGLEPSDLDLTEGEFDIEEVERLAAKFGLTRKENMTIEKARAILKTDIL